ncbi:Na+/H+ antiporter NhaC family protein [Zhaonella formicivorans]|uniref:Na+/H+ antiporter NhaC family protein n=1 Tax=Zhaonella formicivorans TaxID=2528593 RepID=UPI001D1293BB|nr:Na+/H+ antiporter NhaC family protein [Zhaonella formicivorans]
MENYGLVSVLPPLVAIVLAIVTREVYLSLLLGILVGTFILNEGNILLMFTKAFDIMFEKVGDPVWNIRTIIYTLMLGSIIGLAVKSGGSEAFARWAGNKIKSRRSGQAVTFLSGIIIFLDDYFNCLIVGSVLRPVCDRFKISREKLAYITDSTAAPVVILMPISSWVAYIIGLLGDQFKQLNITSVTPFMQFVYTIPYNLYAWLTLIMVGVIIFTNLEYGPMAKAEKRAIVTGKMYEETSTAPPGDDFNNIKVSSKGKAVDMFFPIIALVATVAIFMLYTGKYFDGGITIGQAFQQTDSVTALVYGTFATLVLTVLFYQVRGVVSIIDSMEGVIQGMKAMMGGLVILALAWTIGGVTSELGTGAYVAEVVSKNLPVDIIPATIFIVACFMAFSTGTSWGTFAIMIPIAVPLALASGASMTMCLAALFSGAIFGDHCSPLSDTTILSSTGAGCPHVDHVRTQLPYALTVAACAFVGFLIAGWGFTGEGFILPFLVALGLLIGAMYVLHRLNKDTILELDRHIEKADL